MRQSKIITILLACLVASTFSACASSKSEIKHHKNYVSIGSKSAQLPPGTAEYCWEEPIVEFEQNEAGLNQTGTWYSPSHVAVRQVRGGKWRPCRPYISDPAN